MKQKYIIYREKPKDATQYEEIKKIRNETDAIAFVEDPDNIRLYGNLFLTYIGTDGITYEWNTSSHQWDWPNLDTALADNMKEGNNTMEIKVKYHCNDIEHMQQTEKGDWIDLRAAERVEMKAGDFKIISLGISMKLPEGYEAHIVPRSSTFKRWGILQTNHMGVIDNSYSGENDIWRFPALAMRDTIIEKGDRICQFRIVKKMELVKFVEVDRMEDADRGGFGSSGVN